MEKTVSLYLLKIQWLVSLFATKGMVYLLTVDCISAGFQQLIKRALKFKISHSWLKVSCLALLCIPGKVTYPWFENYNIFKCWGITINLAVYETCKANTEIRIVTLQLVSFSKDECGWLSELWLSLQSENCNFISYSWLVSR